jgi:O-antigen/teichoic acid export membrane protein
MTLLNKIIAKFNLSRNKIKVLKNVYWAVLGKIINILNGLFIGVFIARYLGPESFGLMNYVIGYVALFSVISSFGLDNIEIRELSKKNVKVNEVMGTAFRLRLLFSLIAIVLIIITLLIFESDFVTFYMVMIYAFSLLLGSLNVIRNYFTSIVLNEYVIKSEIFRTLIGALIKIVLLIYKVPLEYFIIAITFDALLIASGYFFSYQRKVGSVKNWRYNKKTAKYLIYQSLPMLLSGSVVLVYQKIDIVIIRNMIDTSAVGQFSVASRITDLAIFIPLVIIQTITPLLVKLHEDNHIMYLKKRRQLMDLMVWVSIILALAITLLAKPIVLLLFGKEYIEAIPVLSIIAWKIVFITLFNVSGQIIIIEGIQKFTVFRNLIGCFISLSMNFLLIPNYGVIGSAYAIVLTFAFSGYLSHLFVKPYKFLFKIQTNSIFTGWSSLLHLKNNIKI